MSPADSLAQIRDGYLAALAADAASPQPDYELDGKKVKRSDWRKGLLEAVATANATINAMTPYRLNTVVRT